MTPAQQEEYMSYLASPAGTARLLVETNVKVAAYESQITGLKVELAAMQKDRDEEGLQRVSKERNNALIALDEARAAADAQADEIARLKGDEYLLTRDALIETLRKERDAESRLRWKLGEEEAKMRAERDAALLDLSQARADLSQALAQLDLSRQTYASIRDERDAALLDLSQARAELHAIAETCSERGIPTAHEKGPYTLAQRVQLLADNQEQDERYREKYKAERDTAISRAESAEASAAAMRTALANVLAERYRLGDFAAKSERTADFERDAIDTASDAGRALLDRHAAELAQMRATVAASEAQTVDYAGRLGAADDVIAQMREENARLAANIDVAAREILVRSNDRDAAQSRLGRVVAALSELTCNGCSLRVGFTGARGYDGSRGNCAHCAPARAILADSTATSAADAYRAQQEERAELEAVYEAAKHLLAPDADPNDVGLLGTAVAKVDARRGRDNGYKCTCKVFCGGACR